MAFIEVEPGVRLYYEEFGTGIPFVFVHGAAMSHEMWEQQVYELADHYRVVTYDLRGHGQSDKPGAGYTIDRFVLDLAALVRHLRLPEMTLVCHGIGGYVGIRFAVQEPGLVSRLVLVSTGARFIGEDAERGGFSPEVWRTYTTGMAANKAAASAWLMDQTFFYRDPGEATRQAMLAIMLQCPAYAMKQLSRDLERVDLEPILKEVRAPTLVIHGVHDRKQRYSGAAYLAAKIPRARLISFAESAHNPQLEEVGRFNRLLVDLVENRLDV